MENALILFTTFKSIAGYWYFNGNRSNILVHVNTNAIGVPQDIELIKAIHLFLFLSVYTTLFYGAINDAVTLHTYEFLYSNHGIESGNSFEFYMR